MSNIAAAPARAQMNFEQVRQILPQRIPMIMVDRVTEIGPGPRIVAVKNVTGSEFCFLGHFPQMAVLPGVLIIEAAAQTMILLCSSEESGRAEAHGGDLHYLAQANVSFHIPVTPGDQMIIEANVTRRMGPLLIAKVTVSVRDSIVARGVITLARKAA